MHGGLSPKHIQNLRNLVKNKKVSVFIKEPQFSDKALLKIIPSEKTTIVTVDYLGSNLPLTKNLFELTLENILKAITLN